MDGSATLSAPETLSARERTVLALIADGMSNRDIAARLTVSTGTVKADIGSLLRLLGAKNRAEAVASAVRAGVLGENGNGVERSPQPDYDPASNGESLRGWRDEHVEVLLDVADSMTSADGSRRSLDRLAELALRATGADRCAILVRDPAGMRRLLPAAGASRVGDPEHLWRVFREMEPIDVGNDPVRGPFWGITHAVTLDDANESPLIPQRWRRVWDVRSLAFTTLRAGGEFFGILAVVYDKDRHHFTPEESRLLETIGTAAGVALRSARLVERLQQAVAVERRLAECAAAMQSGRSLSEVLDLVTDRFVSLLPGASCWINLLSSDGRSFSRVASTIDQSTPSEMRLDELPQGDVSLIRQIWLRDPRHPIVIPDIRSRAGWERIIPTEIQTGMLLPLSGTDGLHGFIAVGREGPSFSPEEVAIAVSFADRVGFAVTQARLTDALQRRFKVNDALHRLSDTVVRTSDLRAALTTLNRDVCAEFGVECVRLAFRDASFARDLRLPPPSDAETTMIDAWNRVGDGEVHSDEAMALPVPMGNKTAGVLWVRVGEFDAGRVELAKAVAVGLGEVALKAKLRRTSERRARQLAVAAERERLAHDLHEAVGETFYGMGLKLQDLLHDVGDDALVARLKDLREVAAVGVADVRSAVDALSALHLGALGFLPSVRMLARQFTQASGVTADLRSEDKLPPLPKEVESALYRTIHEALVNVDRHARSTGVVISLRGGLGQVELIIRDDGVGLDQRQVRDWRSAAHLGLRRMARSIEEVGGRFGVSAATPRGLVMRAIVPLRTRRSER